MYGKKRIVLNKKNQIILAGKAEGSQGGSWIPIGIFRVSSETGNVITKFLKPENLFDSKLTDENSITINLKSIKEARSIVRQFYKIKK